MTLAILSTPSTLANDYGQLEKKTILSLHEERVHNLVASSADIRNSIEGGRSVAGMSPQEESWANEFEALMNSDEEKDYLGLALKL